MRAASLGARRSRHTSISAIWRFLDRYGISFKKPPRRRTDALGRGRRAAAVSAASARSTIQAPRSLPSSWKCRQGAGGPTSHRLNPCKEPIAGSACAVSPSLPCTLNVYRASAQEAIKGVLSGKARELYHPKSVSSMPRTPLASRCFLRVITKSSVNLIAVQSSA